MSRVGGGLIVKTKKTKTTECQLALLNINQQHAIWRQIHN
jgi:hypothetical protein